MLNLDALAAANMIRLPQFKNKHGGIAHAKADGSDWCPAQWLQAFIGEVGEFAEVRVAFEAGEITFDEYSTKAAKELADIQTYLSIMCRRALDVERDERYTPAHAMMQLLATLGSFANERKKLERGDLSTTEYTPKAHSAMLGISTDVMSLQRVVFDAPESDVPMIVNERGIDISKATIEKFNEVSKRVGADVWLTDDGRVLRAPLADPKAY